jgi:hypothetical protein
MPACWAPISPIGHVEAKVFRQGDGRQRDRHLAGDPVNVEPLLIKSDAGRADPVVRRGPFGTRLLGPLRGLEGGRRDTGARLGRGNREDRSQHQFHRSRAPPARRCGRKPCRARIPDTLPHPSEVAAKLIPLCMPGCTETGKLFRVAENRFFDYRLPE